MVPLSPLVELTLFDLWDLVTDLTGKQIGDINSQRSSGSFDCRRLWGPRTRILLLCMNVYGLDP